MSAKVLSLILLLWAPLGWGLDSSLARSPQWLRLGHYEKTWFGPRSPFKGSFFLHPNGARDPLAELNATVEAFLRPTPDQVAKLKMHPQCFFAARFKFLNEHLHFDAKDVQPCEERKAWKSKLNASNVSLIFASADLNNAPSTFGHTFIKLNNPENKNKELLDYGISYAADGNPNEAVFYALKGLFGLYDGYFSMLPYHQKIREYTNMEGRDIWEFPLNLTPTEVDTLIDHLLEMEAGRAPYWFLSDNCAYQLIKALEVAKPELNISESLPIYSIPLDLAKHLTRTKGLTGAPLYQKSLKTEYMQNYSRLSGIQRDELWETIRTLQGRDPEVLETAMKYYALKAYQTQTDQDSAKYALSVQRAKLGMVTKELQTPLPPPPHLSHDSGGFYIGRGEDKGHGHFTSVRVRPAFHDLEQNDTGMLPFSHIEVMSVEARYYETEKRTTLHQFTLVDLINTTPLTHLDKHFSWRARGALIDQWQPDAIGGLGATYDLLPHLRMTQFLGARAFEEFLGAGANVLVAARINSVGLSIDAGYYFATNSRQMWELKSKLDVQLSRNWDLQLEHWNRGERHAKLLFNFLF